MNTTESELEDEYIKTRSRKISIKSPNRRTTRLDHFSYMKIKEEMKQKDYIDEEEDYETMKRKLQMIDRDEISDQLNMFIFDRSESNIENKFTKTRYADNNAFPNFYEKRR